MEEREKYETIIPYSEGRDSATLYLELEFGHSILHTMNARLSIVRPRPTVVDS